MRNKLLFLVCISLLLIPITCMAEPPEKPPGDSNSNSSSIKHTGVLKVKSSKVLEGKTYESTKGGQNVILITNGDSTFTNFTINKTGNDKSEEADFYGTNAAIFAKSGSLNISKSSITTDGSYANGVFSYDKGIINISDSKIITSKNNSGGIMVTGGGTLTATNCTVKTSGNSSASIRSDRGGGTLTIKGGTYEASGMGSPTVYSTAKITVEEATLNSTSAEGIVVEGANSVTLKNTKLTDNNVTLNGNSETYKNIFLYQSMSGDADKGTANFTSTDSNITTQKGDTIFVTNTTAEINLKDNTITNTSGDFLRIEKGKWGNSGSNGGNVTLTLDTQKVEGSIIVDKISTLTMNMKNNSLLKGAINTKNEAKNLKVVLSSDSTIVLTGDTYLTELNNEVKDNSNIYLNGYSLYVAGEKVAANEGEYQEETEPEGTDALTTDEEDTNSTFDYIKEHLPIIGALFALFVLLLVVAITIIKRKRS